MYLVLLEVAKTTRRLIQTHFSVQLDRLKAVVGEKRREMVNRMGVAIHRDNA